MNILMLTSEFSPANGGIGTYAREIAIAVTQLGAGVTMIAPDYGKDNTTEDRNLPFEVRRYQGGLHSMRDLPSKIRLARRHVASGRFDVVHAADWPFFIPLALSRGLTQARMMMTVHGTEINESQTTLKRLAIRCAGVFGPRTVVAANSRYTRALFLKRFAIDAERVHAISLGVSDFWFGARQMRSTTRAAYAIATDRIVVVTVARLTRRKGHLLTLSALRSLRSDLRRRITWLVIGPEGEPDYVRQLRTLAQAADCDIRFLGTLSDERIRDVYGAADFFCLNGQADCSGRIEGFGLVYLEAGAAGLPSVATNIGGVSDAVIGGETGFLVAPSTDEITRAIATLACDSARRRTLAIGAMTHAGRSSWRRCAAETYGLASSVTDIVDSARQPLAEILAPQSGSIPPAYSDLSNA